MLRPAHILLLYCSPRAVEVWICFFVALYRRRRIHDFIIITWRRIYFDLHTYFNVNYIRRGWWGGLYFIIVQKPANNRVFDRDVRIMIVLRSVTILYEYYYYFAYFFFVRNPTYRPVIWSTRCVKIIVFIY